MANELIRDFAKAHSVKLWEIADAMGIYDYNFSRMLRRELDEKDQERIMLIIMNICEGRGDFRD